MSTRQIFSHLQPCLDSIMSKSLFDLVHWDVWGPSPMSFILGFHYFIGFINDFSSTSCVYLVKDRTYVLPFVHKFF